MIEIKSLDLNSLSERILPAESDTAGRRRVKYCLIILILALGAVGSYFLTGKIEPHFTWLKQFKALGIIGVFLIALISNAFVIVALPPVGIPIAIVAASQNGLFPVTIAYSLGAVIGESVSYFVGLGIWGRKKTVIRSNYFARRVEILLAKDGKRGFVLRNIALVFLSASPFPPFDIIGILAGAVRYPFWQFSVSCFLGRIIKYGILFSGYDTVKTLFHF